MALFFWLRFGWLVLQSTKGELPGEVNLRAKTVFKALLIDVIVDVKSLHFYIMSQEQVEQTTTEQQSQEEAKVETKEQEQIETTIEDNHLPPEAEENNVNTPVETPGEDKVEEANEETENEKVLEQSAEDKSTQAAVTE